MKNRVFSVLKFLIGWPLSILALFFIAKLIGPQASQYLSHLNQISLPLLTAGIVSFLAYYFFRGYIWKELVKHAGYDMSYKDTNFIWAASELQRYIPGNIWSFLGRSVMLNEKGISKKDIARLTIFEIQFLILGSAITSFLALPFLTNYLNLSESLSSLLLLGFITLIVFYVFHEKLNIKLFFLPNYHPRAMVFLIFLNALLFLFFGLGYYFTFASYVPFDPNLIWQLTGVSVLAYLIGYLSILTPSGIGVREGALVFALAKIMPTATAGFVSLFGRFILIVAEIIFVFLSYIWHKTKNTYLSKGEKWIGEHKHLTILFVLFLIYTVYFTVISSLRYDHYYAGRFDLGNMAQTVWNTTQGRIFTLTDSNGTEVVSRLSVHADFILILLAPFYALWSDPRMLLFIQAIVVAMGAFFVYFIAEKVLKNKNLSFVFAFAYLINPSLQRANLYDFHAVALATTFLLGTFYFFINKQYKIFLIFAFLAGICKEQVWLILSLFGVFLFFQHKKRVAGALLFAFCLLLTYFIISYAIPNALGARHFALEYYAEFGNGPLDIIKNIIFSPQQTLSILFQPDRIDYLKQLLIPLGYVSLLAPLFLIFAGPDLVINLMSSNPNLHQIYYQYTTTITPFLFIAAIYGATLIKKIAMEQLSNGTINLLLMLYILFSSFYGAYSFGPLPGARDANLDMITKQYKDREFVENYISSIDKSYAVASSNNIGSHFSNRERIYVLPLGIDKADILVFLLSDSEFPDSLEQQRTLVEQLKQDPSFQLEVERGEFIVFKRIKMTSLSPWYL